MKSGLEAIAVGASAVEATKLEARLNDGVWTLTPRN
jgi:hypothetical protein